MIGLGAWMSDTEIVDREVQVWPARDAIVHQLHGLGCPCRPRIELHPNGNRSVVHNSVDGRSP